MAYIVMALYSDGPIWLWPYIVMAPYSYGLYRYGLSSYGLYSYGPIYLWPHIVTACIVMGHIVMAMAYGYDLSTWESSSSGARSIYKTMVYIYTMVRAVLADVVMAYIALMARMVVAQI